LAKGCKGANIFDCHLNPDIIKSLINSFYRKVARRISIRRTKVILLQSIQPQRLKPLVIS